LAKQAKPNKIRTMNDKEILMKLETERLYIKLLTLDQLKL
jgi:hypothetical protein